MDDYLNVLRIRILHCFSALKNVKSFINTAPFSDDIQCLHGIRGLSFVFIIMFHTGSEIFIRDRLYNNDTIIQVNNITYLFHFKPSIMLIF